MHSNWLNILWLKNFSFLFVIHNTIYNIIVSVEAILSAENREKSLGGQGSAPNHTGELTPVIY